MPVIETRSPPVWSTLFDTTIALVVACAGLTAIDLAPVTAPALADKVPSVSVPPVIVPLAVKAVTPVTAPPVKLTDSTMTMPLVEMIVSEVDPLCVIVAVLCEMICAACADIVTVPDAVIAADVVAPVSVVVPATAKLPAATLSADWPAFPVIETRSPPVWSTLFDTTIALVVACAGLTAIDVAPVMAPAVKLTDSTTTLPFVEMIVSDVDPLCVTVAVACEMICAAWAANVAVPVSVDAPATASVELRVVAPVTESVPDMAELAATTSVSV